MVEDVTYLREIEILSYPTEEVFKEAVLALNLPPEQIDEKNLDAELLALMLKTTPMIVVVMVECHHRRQVHQETIRAIV